jgi:FMN-dependent NADH-azoreductase
MATKTLVVYGGGREVGSVSRAVTTKLLEKLGVTAENSVAKDLFKDAPSFVDPNWISARFNPAATDDEKNSAVVVASNAAVTELLAAEVLVLSTPMYNFNVPGCVKTWFDQVAVVGQTFKYGAAGPEGLLTCKKAYVVVSTGGVELGTPADFLTPYVKFFLGFLGIVDVTFISVGKGDTVAAQAQIDALIL